MPRHDVAGYALGRNDRLTLCHKMINCPITYEHCGISDAVRDTGANPSPRDVVRALRTSAALHDDPKRTALGIVVDAWMCDDGGMMCAFVVNGANFPRLVLLIKNFKLRGLSLSHLHGGGVTPLEVSLCTHPARPGCFVRSTLHSGKEVQTYKAMSMHVVHQTMESAPADTSPAGAMQALLADMKPEARSLISAAINTFKTKLDASKIKLEQVQSDNEAMRCAAAVDKDLMTAQIEAIVATMGKPNCDKFGITANSCAKNMNSDNVDVVRRQVDRLLMACNQHMLSAHVAVQARSNAKDAPHAENDHERPNKRKAESTPLVVEPDAPDAGDLLQQALEAI